MQLLLSRAGLALNPGQIADLVLAWRQVAGLITSIPRDRPLSDDMSLVFRLAPPAAGTAAEGAEEAARAPASPQARRKRAAGPVQRAKSKAKAKSKAATAKKRVAKRPAAKSPAAKSPVRKKARRKK
jgi:hypothetical protein